VSYTAPGWVTVVRWRPKALMSAVNNYVSRCLRHAAKFRGTRSGGQDACGAGFATRSHVEFQIMLCELHYPPVWGVRPFSASRLNQTSEP
jgi:hypothetical protein